MLIDAVCYQALKASLCNVLPVSGIWKTKAVELMRTLTLNKFLSMVVLSTSHDLCRVHLFEPTTNEFIHQHLVAQGFAETT